MHRTRHFFRSLFSLATSFFLLTSLPAFSFEEEGSTKNFCFISETKNKLDSQKNSINNRNSGDLEAIVERGTLRVLIQKKNNNCIVSKTEKLLIEEFANIHELQIHWFYVDNEWELVSELITGSVDVVVGQNQSLVSGLHNKIDFTQS